MVFLISSLKNLPFWPILTINQGRVLILLEFTRKYPTIFCQVLWNIFLRQWSTFSVSELILRFFRRNGKSLKFKLFLEVLKIGLVTSLFLLVFASSISSSEDIKRATRAVSIFFISSSSTTNCFNANNRVVVF